MKFTDIAYTEPYLMTMDPAHSMDIAFLGRCGMTSAALEYSVNGGQTRIATPERHEIEGMRMPANADGYDPIIENNPTLPVSQFLFHLTDLEPGQRVTYRVRVTSIVNQEAASEWYDFHTAPDVGGDYKFGLVSDLQLFRPCDHTIHQMGRQEMDFILYAGDMINAPWRAGDWFTVPGAWQSEDMTGMAFFDIMQRHDGGIRLMQYMPLFCCPGNHESDDNRVESDKSVAQDESRYTWRIYMQIFRTYYPDQEYGWHGCHWYSVDYADMHISSLTVVRCQHWPMQDWPGSILRGGELSPTSAQGQWLVRDLQESQARFKWIVMHWHMMNRGDDTQLYLCQPVRDPDDPEKAVYPTDYAGEFLHPLFRSSGVIGVNYGHSHVYERYRIDGVNYIEAAYMGRKYGLPDGHVNPSGIYPVNQMHDFRSYMIVSNEHGKLHARAYQASVEPNGYGYEGRIFDEFDL